MKRRIYWLLPDATSAHRTMHDLWWARIDARQIHFAARDGVDMTSLHAATVWQTSDLVHAAQLGLVLGAIVGAVAGLAAAVVLPDADAAPQWEATALLAALGAVVGAWSSSMIGISIASPRLRRFEQAIADGHVLLMVDVPPTQVETVEALLRTTHPEARFEGEEAQMPALREVAGIGSHHLPE